MSMLKDKNFPAEIYIDGKVTDEDFGDGDHGGC